MTGRRASGLFSALNAVTSQAAQSLLVLGLGVALARDLSAASFGVFAMLSALGLVLLGVQRAVILDPWLLRSPTESWMDGRMLAIVWAGSSAAMLAFVLLLGPSYLGLFFAVGQVLLLLADLPRAWLLRWEDDSGLAVADLFALGISFLVWLTVGIDRGAGFLAIAMPLALLVARSSIGARQLVKPSIRLDVRWFRVPSHQARMGRDFMIDVLVVASTGHLGLILIGLLLGAESAAGLRGALLLFGPVNLAVQGLTSNLGPAVAADLRSDRYPKRLMRSLTVGLVVLTLMMWLALTSFPQVPPVLLGETAPLAVPLVGWMAFQRSFAALLLPSTMLMRAAMRSSELLQSRLVGAVGIVASLVLALAIDNVAVFIAGTGLAYLAIGVLLRRHIRRLVSMGGLMAS